MLSKIARCFLYIIIAMVLALLIWAYLCPWPSAVPARFSVTGKNGTVIVYSPAAGYAGKVLVNNGDWVKEGQELIEFITSPQSSIIITASSSGYFLAETSAAGQEVPAGVPLARLTETGPLVLQMFITPENLGQVRPGMPVNVQLDAFPSQYYGSAEARVSWLAVIPTRQSKDGTPLYEVQAEITFASPELVSHLQPGLLGSAEIITGEGRLISRLLPRGALSR
jgi:multidrug efflux pump subunit AcrA (membrane-fusion protein)